MFYNGSCSMFSGRTRVLIGIVLDVRVSGLCLISSPLYSEWDIEEVVPGYCSGVLLTGEEW